MPKVWEQEGFCCTSPYLRGDVKEELKGILRLLKVRGGTPGGKRRDAPPLNGWRQISPVISFAPGRESGMPG
jgi:hypothetical protein